jgi:hypothetical protein
MCDMPATRTRLVIAIAGLLTALGAIVAVMLISPAEPSSEPARQRVAIVTQGVQSDPGSGTFELIPVRAGALKRDSGTERATFDKRIVMREGQTVTITHGVETLEGKRGSLKAHFRIEWVDAGNGYQVATGTWEAMRGTGQHALIAGGGRRGDMWLDRGRGPWSGRAEGFLTVPSGDDETAAPRTPEADAAGRSCGDYRRSLGYPAVRVEVLGGNVPCRAARGVVKDVYTNGYEETSVPGMVRVGAWRCDGPEGWKLCERTDGPHWGTIRARFYGADDADRACCRKMAVDRNAGVRFTLDGRVLTVSLLESTPRKLRRWIRGPRRATCGNGFDDNPRQTRERFWPAERARVRFRYPPDISHIARWCRLEDPVIGQVAFVEFR